MTKSPQTMKLDFEAVAKYYGVPPTRKMEREVLRTMITHDYMTPIKAAQQNVELVNVAHTTLTKTISVLRGRGVPIESITQRDSGNRRYTEYHLNKVEVSAALRAAP